MNPLAGVNRIVLPSALTTAEPLLGSGCWILLIVKLSPSGSESLATVFNVTAVLNGVVTESSFAVGSVLGLSPTITDSVAVAVPPLPSEIV